MQKQHSIIAAQGSNKQTHILDCASQARNPPSAPLLGRRQGTCQRTPGATSTNF